MKVKLFDIDYGYRKGIAFTDDSNRFFNFKDLMWVECPDVCIMPDECVLKLTYEMFLLLAQEIQKDSTIPSPEKSFVEGKLESTLEHLKDMRKLVFKEEE